MRARTVNENYPLGAANDPMAPWNEKEDDSDFELELSDQDLIITRRYNHSAEDEWDEDQATIDPETFDEFAGKKLGIDYQQKYEDDNYLDIGMINLDGNNIEFETSWGTFQTDMEELIDLTDLF